MFVLNICVIYAPYLSSYGICKEMQTTFCELNVLSSQII